jgi:pseudouridine synthase
MSAERVQKLIAAAGLASRRGAEELLRAGRVRINGAVARLGERADPRRDRVSVDGRPLPAPGPGLTLLLNKPAGVLSTCHDPHGRPTVLDLLPADLRRGRGLHPVGRLDADSRGALLLSNDGDLTLRLTHPRYRHPRTYRVWVSGHPGPATLARWRRGVPLDGRPSQPVRLRVLRSGPGRTLLELTLREGRNRQIRRTAELLGHPVEDLQRVAVAGLGLGRLPEGSWRRLEPQELAALRGQGEGDRFPPEWSSPVPPP